MGKLRTIVYFSWYFLLWLSLVAKNQKSVSDSTKVPKGKGVWFVQKLSGSQNSNNPNHYTTLNLQPSWSKRKGTDAKWGSSPSPDAPQDSGETASPQKVKQDMETVSGPQKRRRNKGARSCRHVAGRESIAETLQLQLSVGALRQGGEW
uniref:Uncharacterized protein n=1 Tax=Eutreptiella gymnastica TaxID=73025 RepID=A0A7S1HZC1_9EUGL